MMCERQRAGMATRTDPGPRVRAARVRWCATALLCAVVQLTAPAAAHAWFGWLDHLSGAGPFWTANYEFRLACFGDDSDHVQRLDAFLTRANLLTMEARGDERSFLVARDAWKDFVKELQTINAPGADPQARQQPARGFPVLPQTDVQALSDAIDRLTREDYVEFHRQLAAMYPSSTARPAATTAAALPTSPVTSVATRAASLTARVFRAHVSLNSTGMLWSFCSPTKTRRWAFEFGATFGQANSNPDYAGDHSIRLVTLMPSISYRVFSDPRFDVVDVGAGAGAYWFSSRGFDTFNGWVVQPVRVDLHAPTRWVNSGAFERLAAMLTLRLGFIVFPAGFDANDFAATGDKAVPIGAEWIPTATVFVNLQPLLTHSKRIFAMQ